MPTLRRRIPALVLFGSLIAAPTLFAQGGNDAQLQADVQRQLGKKEFRDVHAAVQGGVVTLTGTVKVLSDKLDADKRIGKLKEASAVHDQIQVNVPEGISDQQLFNKLGKQLLYDRQGYPSYPFNSITLEIHDGVVALGGEVVEPVDKDSAVSIVANTPGVRGLIDHLQVAPVSPMDLGIRRAMYQAIYGASISTRYAVDPAKPIRIVVLNGHVTLTGVVNSTGDRDILGLRAQSVPGVFSVTNDLQVPGGNGASESNR